MTDAPDAGASTGAIPIVYLDASALVKLIASEPERPALLSHLIRFPRRASSELAVLELLRAVRRRAPADEGSAVSALRSLGLHRLDRQVMVEAAALLPRSLGSLDAIHLATALRLGPALGAFVTYDRALAGAAAGAGLPVATPV